MGIKTVANDLDNARVTFDRVRLPRSALLNKFADISPRERTCKSTRTRRCASRSSASGC